MYTILINGKYTFKKNNSLCIMVYITQTVKLTSVNNLKNKKKYLCMSKNYLKNI